VHDSAYPATSWTPTGACLPATQIMGLFFHERYYRAENISIREKRTFVNGEAGPENIKSTWKKGQMSSSYTAAQEVKHQLVLDGRGHLLGNGQLSDPLQSWGFSGSLYEDDRFLSFKHL
jgi:hypothetical protein